MMNYECLLYGIKGLMYGIPVSIGVTYLIYRSIAEGLETKFFVPWYSMAITVWKRVYSSVFNNAVFHEQDKKGQPH